MGRVSHMIDHLSGGDTEGFKNYLLDRSKAFKPLVKKRVEGLAMLFLEICVFF
jgi:phage major head subunit gpT-like protein